VYDVIIQAKDATSPLLFRIPAMANAYTELSDSFLFLKCRLVDSNSNAIASNDVVTASHLAFHALFSDLVISLNGVPVTNTLCQYALQAVMLETITRTYGEKKSGMSSNFYYEDQIQDDFDPQRNSGFKKRQLFTTNSQFFELVGKPYTALFCNPEYLPNDLPIEMTFSRSKPQICVDTKSTTKQFYIQIDTARLYIRHYSVSSDTLARNNARFAKGGLATYQLHEAEVRVAHISSTSLSFQSDSVFSSIPQYLLIGY